MFAFGILNVLDVDESSALIRLKMDVQMLWNDTRISAENPECTGAVANSEWDKIYRYRGARLIVPRFWKSKIEQIGGLNDKESKLKTRYG